MRFIFPSHGRFQVTSPYGAMESFRKKPHSGIDLGMPEGTNIHSVSDGIVSHVVDYGNVNIGKGVIVKLEDGTNAIYGHMSDIDVKVGEHVNAGDLLGESGSTGFSTGPHLHFGLTKNGESIDPTELVDVIRDMSSGGGGDAHKGILWKVIEDGIAVGKESAKEKMKDTAKEYTQEIINGIMEVLKETFIDMAYSAALIGGGLCILFKVAGWDNGYKWAGIVFLASILVRYLLS